MLWPPLPDLQPLPSPFFFFFFLLFFVLIQRMASSCGDVLVHHLPPLPRPLLRVAQVTPPHAHASVDEETLQRSVRRHRGMGWEHRTLMPGQERGTRRGR